MSQDFMDQLLAWFEKSAVSEGRDDVRREGTELLERRTGLTLPEDFRRYLLTLSPGSENLDDEMTTWWWTGRIKTIPEEFEHAIRHPEIAAVAEQYLFFADYSLWCWGWAIACTQDENRGRVAMIGGTPESDRFVAESFDAFVKLYFCDPMSVC